jgi:hypothetical protein
MSVERAIVDAMEERVNGSWTNVSKSLERNDPEPRDYFEPRLQQLSWCVAASGGSSVSEGAAAVASPAAWAAPSERGAVPSEWEAVPTQRLRT